MLLINFDMYSVKAGEVLMIKKVNKDGSYLSSRVLNATPLQLVAIVYEGMFDAIEKACLELEEGNVAEYGYEADRAVALLNELLDTLDFSVGMSEDLGAIYIFCRNLMLKAKVTRNAALWKQAEDILKPLYEGFSEIAGLEAAAMQDGTTPMNRVQGIVSGLTYGKGKLNEYVEKGESSGLKA